KVAFIRALDGSGPGRISAVFGGTSAPLSPRTLLPKVLWPTNLKKPPGQRPAFCVSTFSVYSVSPQNAAPVSTPPVATTCGVSSMSTSSTTPFFAISSRKPPQLPVSRGRDQRSPPHVSGVSIGCASAAADAASSTPSVAIQRVVLIDILPGAPMITRT